MSNIMIRTVMDVTFRNLRHIFKSSYTTVEPTPCKVD